MKKWTFLFAIATILCSCDNNDEVKEENKIIGTWELTWIGRATAYVVLPEDGVKYVFNSDNTFTKSDLASAAWKDEGTWLYNEDTKQLNFTFKTYNLATNEVSDTKLLTVTVEELTDEQLLLKIRLQRSLFRSILRVSIRTFF
jgi:hypothetical protein